MRDGYMGVVIFLIILFLLKLLADGSLDFIYPIIIGILAIICPIVSCILLYDGGHEILLSCVFLILITIVEFIAVIFLSSKFLITSNTKKNRKVIGYILIITSVLWILLIIIRCLIVLL